MEKSKVIRSLIYKFTERFAAKLIGFVIQIMLARLLAPELFGQVVLLQTIIDFFVLVIENGVNTSLIQSPRVSERDYFTVFVITFALTGVTFLAVEAAELSRKGLDARDAAKVLDADVPHICQYFTVDDLNFLKKTGRVSGFTSRIGTVLNVKPILYGDSTGHIVSCMKVRGRKKAIEALAAKYREKKLDGPEQRICISHGDCLADAETLAGLVRAITPGIPITICQHEPFSGSHVGPGMLGLFFRGIER
jgi:DegV family protein with EDD domain